MNHSKKLSSKAIKATQGNYLTIRKLIATANPGIKIRYVVDSKGEVSIVTSHRNFIAAIVGNSKEEGSVEQAAASQKLVLCTEQADRLEAVGQPNANQRAALQKIHDATRKPVMLAGRLLIASSWIQDIKLDSLASEQLEDCKRFIQYQEGMTVPMYGMVTDELVGKADKYNLESAKQHLAGRDKEELADEVAERVDKKFVLLVNDRIVDGHHFVASCIKAEWTASLKCLDLTACRLQVEEQQGDDPLADREVKGTFRLSRNHPGVRAYETLEKLQTVKAQQVQLDIKKKVALRLLADRYQGGSNQQVALSCKQAADSSQEEGSAAVRATQRPAGSSKVAPLWTAPQQGSNFDRDSAPEGVQLSRRSPTYPTVRKGGCTSSGVIDPCGLAKWEVVGSTCYWAQQDLPSCEQQAAVDKLYKFTFKHKAQSRSTT